MCVRLNKRPQLLHMQKKKKHCLNKPIQTYHRRLLSTWLSNRYFSMFNVTASMLLWYFSALQSFQHAVCNKGTKRSIMLDLAVVLLSGCFHCWIASVFFPVVFLPKQSLVFCTQLSWYSLLIPHHISTNKFFFCIFFQGKLYTEFFYQRFCRIFWWQ